MEEELISIIVPIYNTEQESLNYCLKCLSNQSYRNIEIICVDGGSDQHVIKIIGTFLDDKRFRLIKTFPGVSHQRNIGIESSKGSYILFVDSDDFFDSNYVSLLYYNLVASNSDVAIPMTHRCVFLNGDLISDKPCEIVPVDTKITKDNFFQYARSCGLIEMGKMYKASLIKNIRFNVNCSYGEDKFFNYDVSKIGFFTCLVKEAIYNYRIIAGSNSAERRIDDKKGFFAVRELASIIKSKEIKTKESMEGLYKEFDYTFNSFYYALARKKRLLRLIWMNQFKTIYIKRHHNIHDLLYLLFPILIVNRRVKKI